MLDDEWRLLFSYRLRLYVPSMYIAYTSRQLIGSIKVIVSMQMYETMVFKVCLILGIILFRNFKCESRSWSSGLRVIMKWCNSKTVKSLISWLVLIVQSFLFFNEITKVLIYKRAFCLCVCGLIPAGMR